MCELYQIQRLLREHHTTLAERLAVAPPPLPALSMKFNLHGVLLFFRSFFSRRGAEAQSVRGVFVRQDLQDSQDYFDHPK